ncbi:MAG TPA: transferrin receptor-like dimerization domain-containing protein [Phenylobacterium sp.]|nr:transferrin receptor-like dimerization domain-containing protein [Phenylobacterium sp.]
MRPTASSIAALLAAAALAAPALAQSSPDLEKRFDAQIAPAEMTGWLKRLAAEPNHVGAPHNKANAEWVMAQFKAWGWDARMETFQVLYPTPISESLELIAPTPFKATLTEAPVPGDESSSRTQGQLPAYVAYQGDGDVTAPLVYVNYGMPADYEALARMGVSVKGKIVIARYGAGWRGLKPKLAQEHGAVGCIIYSDPQQDGYGEGDAYPKGGARPSQGFQRGSVVDLTTHPGDPLTPGVGATEKAKRLKREDAPTILKIPVLPISYGDAQHFLQALEGNVVPANWRGQLPMTYHVGGTDAAKVHIAVKSDWSLKTVYDVVATLKGSDLPDQWVLRGNHRDGWVFGAADPLSGHVAMMAEAQAIGKLAAAGYRPKRTLVYLSWDGEEPGLLGSTEWAETHAEELKSKAVVYLNTDNSERGLFGAEGSHAYEHLITQAAGDVTDPETGVSVVQRARGALQVAASQPGANEAVRAQAKVAADPSRDLPIGPLGSGSDYSAFIGHLGVASINLGFGGEGESGGVYHSAYDTWEHFTRFDDPGLVYSGTLAKIAGRLVLRLADSDLPLQRYGNFADTVATYNDELKRLADGKREAQVAQAKLIAADAYRLADDPTRTNGPPTPLSPVPFFNLAPLDNAVDHLKRSARAYDAALAARGADLSPAAKARLFEMQRVLEQSLTSEVGLPTRPWYRNLIYAPGKFTGYGAKTLPGVREAIEEERWTDADRYSVLTAQVIETYAGKLDAATKLINGE